MLARQHNPGLENVEWILGDGTTLDGVPSGTLDASVSHVVFQHIPHPTITLGYVRELGRVLRPGGWAAFQVSNDPEVHRRPPLRARVMSAVLPLTRSRPQGQRDPRWLGSMIDLGELRAAAADGSMAVERVVGAGTQFCLVLTRRLNCSAGMANAPRAGSARAG